MAKAKRKSRAVMLAIDLPDNGLNYDGFGDRELENHAEYCASMEDAGYKDGDSYECNHHELLRLDANEVQSIAFDCTDWSKMRAYAYECHTEAVNEQASKDIGFELEIEHSKSHTGLIKLSVAKRLFRRSQRASHAKLEELFEEEDCSWHSRRFADLIAKPVVDWDAKELGWLLMAVWQAPYEVSLDLSTFEMLARKAAGLPTTRWIEASSESEINAAIFDSIYGGETEQRAWEKAMDWKAYEKKIQEARQDKFDELEDYEHQMLIDGGWWAGDKSISPRCPLTLELPLAA